MVLEDTNDAKRVKPMSHVTADGFEVELVAYVLRSVAYQIYDDMDAG